MIVIGKFREIYKDDRLPSILTAIRNDVPKEKEKILAYMKNATISAMSPGCVRDVIEGDKLIRNLICYTDGKYLWRSDIVYYFEKYNIELPGDFVKHILETHRKNV